MRILVTGATGLLGNNIVRQGMEAGHHMIALMRTPDRPPALLGLDSEVAIGDVNDAESLVRAARGVDVILHSAGLIHIGWEEREASNLVNVLGTQAVIAAARHAKARLVFVSTVDTLAIGHSEQASDETSLMDGQVPCTYVQSKRQAEHLVDEAAENDLDACVVHPGYMLGPWDWKPSSGRMLLAVGRQWTPVAPAGGCSVCDVRDVAQGVLQAAAHGVRGRHYILAGENLSYLKLWQKFARVSQVPAPLFAYPWIVSALIGAIGDLVTKISGTERDINSATLRMSRQFHYYNSDRARSELGYTTRNVDLSIADAQAWFKAHAYT